MESTKQDPLFGEHYVEGRGLQGAPVIRVLAQVRWPNFANHEARIGILLEALNSELGEEYPRYEAAQEIQLVLGGDAFQSQQQAGPTLHRLSSWDLAWTITLAPGFIVLETAKYTRRSDFLARLGRVLSVIQETRQIPVISRVGYRYTNRVDDPAELDAWIDRLIPSMRGHFGLPLSDSISPIQSTGEALMSIDDRGLMARWAVLPPNAVIEPTIPPSPRLSWILDLDSFREQEGAFDVEAVLVEAGVLAANAFQFFATVTALDEGGLYVDDQQ